MRYLTIIYALPYDYDVRDLISHEYMSACSWSHAIDERKAADTRIEAPEQIQPVDRGWIGEGIHMMQIPQPTEKVWTEQWHQKSGGLLTWMAPVKEIRELTTPGDTQSSAVALDETKSVGGDVYVFLWDIEKQLWKESIQTALNGVGHEQVIKHYGSSVPLGVNDQNDKSDLFPTVHAK